MHFELWEVIICNTCFCQLVHFLCFRFLKVCCLLFKCSISISLCLHIYRECSVFTKWNALYWHIFVLEWVNWLVASRLLLLIILLLHFHHFLFVIDCCLALNHLVSHFNASSHLWLHIVISLWTVPYHLLLHCSHLYIIQWLLYQSWSLIQVDVFLLHSFLIHQILETFIVLFPCKSIEFFFLSRIYKSKIRSNLICTHHNSLSVRTASPSRMRMRLFSCYIMH
jgi:hypothetical protein